MNDTEIQELETLRAWAKDVFLYVEDTLKIKPAEPLNELINVEIPYTDKHGYKHKAKLFDVDGRLVYQDLSFYTVDMFKNQSKNDFKRYKGSRLTWQQTVTLEAYNRAINTFGKDSFDDVKRWITVRSGHGTGKTATMSIIALHFLWCFFGAQIGMTANTDQQVNDIFMKEFYVWKGRLPDEMKASINQTDDHIRIEDEKDWFLRAQVARAEKPEALAGLHGKYILILVDEASGVPNKVYEVMKGALTGDNFIVMYYSNPTRTEGEFFDSHKAGSKYTKLHFSSLESPIVKDGYCERWAEEYGVDSDEYRIRVKGEFASTAEMDDKGWIPLFGNVNVHFEPERGQIINGAIIGVDPSGSGKDHSTIVVRDNIYMKLVMREQTSTPKDGARKVETIRDVYHATSNDIGIDAFGVGAKWVAEIDTKIGESVNALLTDKPREETKDKYSTFNAELAWKMREWLVNGGIIITNNPKEWKKELDKIKYKRDGQGRIMLQPKTEFKKDNGFSPDRFDGAKHTFFRDNPNKPVILTKNELERVEAEEFMQKANQTEEDTDMSSW